MNQQIITARRFVKMSEETIASLEMSSTYPVTLIENLKKEIEETKQLIAALEAAEKTLAKHQG